MAKVKKIKEERLEDILMSCRNHLRGKADQSDKCDVLLTLVFLKFMSNRFEEPVRAYARVTEWPARAYARIAGRYYRAYARWGLADG